MVIAASALKAQQARMRVIAENIANADSVATSRRAATPTDARPQSFTPTTMQSGGTGVVMTGVQQDQAAFRTEYSPGNPAADAKGLREDAER